MHLHREDLSMDERVQEICNSMNQLPFFETIGSCEGHINGIGLDGGNGHHLPYIVFTCSKDEFLDALKEKIRSESLLKCEWHIAEFIINDCSYILTVKSTSECSLEDAWNDLEKLSSIVESLKSETR